MANLRYTNIIEEDARFFDLAETGKRFADLNVGSVIIRLIDLVPGEYLPLLAESQSLLNEDGYWLAESDEARRRLIKGAYELHRYKGTPWAIREIVRRLGFGEIEIIEHLGNKFHDGSITRNGIFKHGHSDMWAHYRIVLNKPISQDQARLLRQTLAAFAPARCVLDALDFQAASLLHNGKIKRDGQFTRGTN